MSDAFLLVTIVLVGLLLCILRRVGTAVYHLEDLKSDIEKKDDELRRLLKELRQEMFTH